MTETWNELILTNMFDKVQIMYWRDKHSCYAYDLYYQLTIGM